MLVQRPCISLGTATPGKKRSYISASAAETSQANKALMLYKEGGKSRQWAVATCGYAAHQQQPRLFNVYLFKLVQTRVENLGADSFIDVTFCSNREIFNALFIS
jgi:hypothetical protein